MESEADIVIIGAGMCGLSAAIKLAKAGKRVLIIEARDRTGGRVHTLNWHYSQKVEAGAEFIHGDLPLTQALVKEAGGSIDEDEGEFYSSSKGSVYHARDLVPHMRKVMHAFNELKEDTTLSVFLQTHFTSEEDIETRERIIRQAEGFDAADPDRISVFALREEWGGGSMETAFWIKEGYGSLVDHLTAECMRAGCLIYLSKVVTEIVWEQNQAEILCEDGSSTKTSKVIVTVPLSVLSAPAGEKGAIRFFPAIPEHLKAVHQMGYGSVIKIVLEFGKAFWHDEKFRYECAQIAEFGFLINDSAIPIFWSSEKENIMVTGWVGGTAAAKLKQHSDEALFDIAVKGFAQALVCKESLVREHLLAHAVFNWANDPFAKGAYSYRTPQTLQAKAILNEPLQDTLYFAGEALGDSMGTVEAALESAAFVVKKILM
jgi:monoamine oxidase